MVLVPGIKASRVLPADQNEAVSEPHHDYETGILGKNLLTKALKDYINCS